MKDSGPLKQRLPLNTAEMMRRYSVQTLGKKLKIKLNTSALKGNDLNNDIYSSKFVRFAVQNFKF